jgi:hypothetical protein
MIEQPRTILAVLAGFVLATSAYADMMPVPSVDAARSQSLPAVISEHSPDARYSSSLTCLGIDDLDLLPITVVSESNGDVGQIGEARAPEILADRQNSFDLCLYALIGLGLCRSAPWVKKFSFCQIPDWYHHAGPCQIGHSYAIGPECIGSTTVCFIQPDSVSIEEPSPQCRGEALISLWRKAQFTPTALASRGPPIVS